jgi:hypothetical protein
MDKPPRTGNHGGAKNRWVLGYEVAQIAAQADPQSLQVEQLQIPLEILLDLRLCFVLSRCRNSARADENYSCGIVLLVSDSSAVLL